MTTPRSDFPDSSVTVAELVAEIAASVPGVAGLHAGAFGEVGTYLPGRRVIGVKTTPEVTEVHLVVAQGSQMLLVAQQVRDAVQPLVDTRVDVFIEDIDPTPAGSRVKATTAWQGPSDEGLDPTGRTP